MIPASRKLALGFYCEPLEESGYTWSHTTILGDPLRPDFMLLDVNVGGEMSYQLADALVERGIRFLFVTGYNSPSVLGKYKDHPRLEKPVDFNELNDAILKLMRAS